MNEEAIATMMLKLQAEAILMRLLAIQLVAANALRSDDTLGSFERFSQLFLNELGKMTFPSMTLEAAKITREHLEKTAGILIGTCRNSLEAVVAHRN